LQVLNNFLILQSEIKEINKMRKEIHPKEYRFVVFKDMSNSDTFLCRSTAQTKDTIVYEEDGKEYPLVKLEISRTSHPFYTGKMKLVDTAGRVDKFKTRYKKHFAMKDEEKIEEKTENPQQ
jgi:large subunit ribosomal protein L31